MQSVVWHVCNAKALKSLSQSESCPVVSGPLKDFFVTAMLSFSSHSSRDHAGCLFLSDDTALA